jgi:hypothetical protein
MRVAVTGITAAEAPLLTCREMTELVTDYLEGRLPLLLRLRFRWHLAGCADCRAWLRQMRGTVRLLGRLPAGQMPPQVRAELLERFRGWKARGQPP